MLRKSVRLSLIFVLPVIAALVLTTLALAHGAVLNPLSRIYTCWLENAGSPDTMPCQDLVNMSGTQPIYDWNEVALMTGGSVANSMAIIPDGRLCGAGRDKYIGLDQARADWPVTILPAGGSPYTFRWSVTANHPIANFHFFVTKDGYSPTVPLKWSDLEKFATFSNPTLDTVAGLDMPVYQFPATLPNKTGRHLIYIIWERQDSIEDFYSCSDVWFGSSPTPTPTQAPACTAPAWVAGTYAPGAVVNYNNKEWIAVWSNSEAPSTAPVAAPWKLTGICTSGGGGGPTNTPAAATATRTNTPVVVNTATRTNTPAAATNTPTRTATVGGPTATRTRTPTAGAPTATASRTNTPAAATATATSGAGTCSPVSATITTGFTKDGAGTFCWQASTLGSYINSWNTTSVSINGTNITNLYVASGSYPAKIGGFWYISYNSTGAYGHFETK